MKVKDLKALLEGVDGEIPVYIDNEKGEFDFPEIAISGLSEYDSEDGPVKFFMLANGKGLEIES